MKKQIRKIQKIAPFEKKNDFYFFKGMVGQNALHSNQCDGRGNSFFRENKKNNTIEYVYSKAFLSTYTPFSQKNLSYKQDRCLYKKKIDKKLFEEEKNINRPSRGFFQSTRKEKEFELSRQGSLDFFLQKMNGCQLGYVLFLKLIGLGYKFSLYPLKNKSMMLSVKAGQSHKTKFFIPSTIRVFLFPRNRIAFLSVEREALANIAYQIRQVRPPTPYKGKGIRFENEIILLKEGKKNK
jgi:large subunit ribosomal protein L6